MNMWYPPICMISPTVFHHFPFDCHTPGKSWGHMQTMTLSLLHVLFISSCLKRFALAIHLELSTWVVEEDPMSRSSSPGDCQSWASMATCPFHGESFGVSDGFMSTPSLPLCCFGGLWENSGSIQQMSTVDSWQHVEIARCLLLTFRLRNIVSFINMLS